MTLERRNIAGKSATCEIANILLLPWSRQTGIKHPTSGVIHMIAWGIRTLAVSALIISLLASCSCSKAKEAQNEGKDAKPATQEAAEAIRDFGKKPIDKARAAQKLGDDRTKAIDEAVGSQNRE